MKFVPALALIPVLLIGAATTMAEARSPDPARKPVYGAAYRAVGTEPFWSVTIDRGLIRYEDAARRRITVKAPEARPSFNGRRYVTPRIIIDITRSRCSDGMSDRTFPDSVTVTIGRRTLRGCGGDPVAQMPAPVPPFASAIIAGAWRIASVNGVPTRGEKSAAISFTGDRIGGTTGCNSFGGTFRFERGVLTVTGPLVSTQMGCVGPVMAQESAILNVLRGRLSVSSGTRDNLVLSGPGGGRLVLVRAFPGRG